MAQLGEGMLCESGSTLLGEQTGVWAPDIQCGFEGGCQSTQMLRSDSPPGSPQAPLHISPQAWLLPLPLTLPHPSLSF